MLVWHFWTLSFGVWIIWHSMTFSAFNLTTLPVNHSSFSSKMLKCSKRVERSFPIYSHHITRTRIWLKLEPKFHWFHQARRWEHKPDVTKFIICIFPNFGHNHTHTHTHTHTHIHTALLETVFLGIWLKIGKILSWIQHWFKTENKG